MGVRNFLLKDNVDLTQGEFDRACVLRNQLRALVERRDEMIASYGLDREFCLPDGLWRHVNNPANDFVRAYAHVRDASYDELNRLRFRTGVFPGYHLLTLTHPSQATGPMTSVDPIPPDYDGWLLANRRDPDRYVTYWQAFRRHVPGRLLFSPAKKLGEVGWLVDGIVVNHDTYVYQERVNLLHENGVLGALAALDRPVVLEIGGGYGGLASAIMQVLPRCLYIICDLPESLMFSGLYAQLTGKDVHVADSPERLRALPDSGIILVPNTLFPFLASSGQAVDLAINTLSMSEMSAHQIATYARGIAGMIGSEGVFFEQNQDNRKMDLQDAKLVVAGHFPARRKLAATMTAGTQGTPNLWANTDTALSRVAAHAQTAPWQARLTKFWYLRIMRPWRRLKTLRQQRAGG